MLNSPTPLRAKRESKFLGQFSATKPPTIETKYLSSHNGRGFSDKDRSIVFQCKIDFVQIHLPNKFFSFISQLIFCLTLELCCNRFSRVRCLLFFSNLSSCVFVVTPQGGTQESSSSSSSSSSFAIRRTWSTGVAPCS